MDRMLNEIRCAVANHSRLAIGPLAARILLPHPLALLCYVHRRTSPTIPDRPTADHSNRMTTA
jgi:hypothetical protein